VNLTDLAWLAGIIEGEGYIGFEKNGYRLQLDMTDEDVVLRAYELMGVGTFRVKPTPENRKTIFRWSVRKKEDVVYILYNIQPFMGNRRGARIAEIIKDYEDNVDGPGMA
jgi:hypothetical protein